MFNIEFDMFFSFEKYLKNLRLDQKGKFLSVYGLVTLTVQDLFDVLNGNVLTDVNQRGGEK